ncbi:MAG TPA: lipid II flippase MurJ [Mycobacteriales bacterium]|nr:lipid II flippase MurJ [Mycobacteriales bacterium]
MPAGLSRRLGRGLIGAAAGIALITVAARVVGFGRTAVLGRAVGPTCVGDTYTAANAIPNVVFEVVAGGALASLVVPVLAGAVARGDRAEVARTTGALLTWTVALLVPVALLGALTAPLLVRALLGPDPGCAGAVEVGTRMLLVFLPQVVLYGIGVVLAGALQAHRRFLGPALAPLLSSLVVVTAYLLYAAQRPDGGLAGLSRAQELTLSVGTTLGVAVLSLGLLVPLRRAGVPVRLGWRFPPGVAARARRLAGAGVAALAAQQVALVVALRLAAGGAEGSVVVFVVATALFLVPWAVLAVPLATSAFPLLSASADAGDGDGYAAVASRSLRAVVLVATLSAALLAATAVPAATVLLEGAPGAGAGAAELGRAVGAFAPGLLGYGLVALLSRALYARGEGRAAATATVAGWLTVAAADLALVAALPDVDRVVLLGVGNTAGMTLAGVLLLLALRRTAGAAAVEGAGRALAVGAGAAALATAVALLLPLDAGASVPRALGAGAVLLLVTAGVHLGIARLLDPAGVRSVLRG